MLACSYPFAESKTGIKDLIEDNEVFHIKYMMKQQK